MPQADILAHQNVKLFISHGGLFSTLESLDRGVPLLIVPFFGDQHRNGKRVENAGYGQVLSFYDITADTFATAVNEMLAPTKLARAKEVQALWKDNMVDPMDTFVWWIEYVVKYKGAKHLKSQATEMSWISYLLIDVVVASIAVVAGTIYLLYALLRKLCCRKQAPAKKKKQN